MAKAGKSTIVIVAAVLGCVGLGAVWMLFGASRFEDASAIRWSATIDDHTLLLYEVNVSGSGRYRRFSRLVAIDTRAGQRVALQPLDDEVPFTAMKDELWTWDSRGNQLQTYALPSLAPKRSHAALVAQYPVLAAGIAGQCLVRRPTRVLKMTTQRGERVQLDLTTGEMSSGDGNCDGPPRPYVQPEYELRAEPGSEREGLIHRPSTELIGSTRWLRPKVVEVVDAKTMGGDLMIVSSDLLSDRKPTQLARVHTDGTQAWSMRLPSGNRVRALFELGDLMLVVMDPGVRALELKTGAPRWQY